MKKRSMVVRDYMATELITLDPNTDILQAAHALIKNQISGAPVIDAAGDLIGILTERDVLALSVQAYYHGTLGGIVKDHMTLRPETVDADDSLLDVVQSFISGRFHRFPVVDDGRLVGVISRGDVMRALGEYYPL